MMATSLKDLLARPAPHILLGCTGSVATIKVALLAKRLENRGATVVVIPTYSALHFLSRAEKCDKGYVVKSVVDVNNYNKQSEPSGSTYSDILVESVTRLSDMTENSPKCTYCAKCAELTDKGVRRHDDKTVKGTTWCRWCIVQNQLPELRIIGDVAEWEAWQQRGDDVLHILLRDWAHLMVIAPLSANSLAKLASGLCDNLLTCVVRAWDVKKPLLFCPAMNTQMYRHPITALQISSLKSFGYTEVPSVSKKLMCGDVGVGAMAELETIEEVVWQALSKLGTANEEVENAADNK